MNYLVDLKIMPLKDLLDPAGKAVLGGLGNLGISAVNDVRIGKHIQLQVSAASEEEAASVAEAAAKKLLSNPVMEDYTVNVHQL